MVVKVLLVDDDVAERQTLCNILKKVGEIQIIGKCDDGEQALAFIKDNHVDAVFLNIELPILDGLSVAEHIASRVHSTRVIFTTRFSGFAVRAFELGICDYILKPYTEERLALSVARLTRDNNNRKNCHYYVYNDYKYSNPAKLAVWDKDRMIILDPEKDIFFFKSDNRKTLVYSKKGVIESPLLLKNIEKRFQDSGFLQVHKSYIVNFAMIKEAVPWFNDTYLLKLKDYDGEDVPVSRHFLPIFKKMIQI